MANTIQIIPYSGNPVTPYVGAGTRKTFAEWGVADSFTRTGSVDGGQSAEIVKLEFPGTVNLADIFPFRALIKIVLNDLPFFTGVIPQDAIHFKAGNKNMQIIRIADPLWFLEHRLYFPEIKLVTALAADGTPTLDIIDLTHFTLNLPLATNIINTAPFRSVTYTPNLLNAAQQIAAILDFSKAAGDYLDYRLADLMAVPVEPADVLNITCAEAICRQLDMYDCVMWFDHTQDPPRLHVQRRSALNAISRTIGAGGTVKDYQLRQRNDLNVPFVMVTIEQPYNIGNGFAGVTAKTFIYPPLLDATPLVVNLGGGLTATVYEPTIQLSAAPNVDSLNALITAIPIKGIQQSTTSKFIQTSYIAPNDITWWQDRRRDMDPAFNPNFATDYDGLAIVPNSGVRNLDPNDYPNMIIAGGWAPWMGGSFGCDHILARCKYNRKTSASIPGTNVSSHTLHANATVTNLDYPDGAWLSYVTTSSTGEFFDALSTVPELVYTDLSAKQWQGTINIVEQAWRGDLTVGHVFNLLGDNAKYATMNALIQGVDIVVKTGGIFYTLTVGPNKSISPNLIAQRLKAARWRYVTALTGLGNFNYGDFFGRTNVGAPNGTVMTQQDATDSVSDAHPAISEQNVYDPDPNKAGYGGLATITGGAGKPGLKIGYVDANGVQDPTMPSIDLNLDDIVTALKLKT